MSEANAILEAIYSRRSVRRFEEGRAVEREKIVELLKAAMAAPSACNIQPWEFVVVTQPELVDKVKITTGDNGQYNAGAIIAVCGDDSRIPWKDHGVVDCAAAMENMLVAAPSLGLGAVVIGGFDRDELRSLLGIPEGIYPVCLVYLGYPEERKQPRTRYLEEAVHWNLFDGSRQRGPRPGDIIVYGGAASL
jgi:nitroreductase